MQRIVLLIATLSVVLFASTMVFADLSVGTKAPDFTLKTTKDTKYTLYDNYKTPAKLVLIDLWSIRCGPCKQEVPYLIELYKKYKDKGLEVVGIALDQDTNAVKNTVKQMSINYNVVLDPGAQVTGAKYKLQYVPATYITDKTGVIKLAHCGFPSDKTEQKRVIQEMENTIKKLLGITQ